MHRPADLLFDPASVMWKISRERVILLYGPAAAVLQVAHPAVAAGVAEHSDFQNAPLRRLRHTLAAVYAITFGTMNVAEQTSSKIAALHDRVKSDERSPQRYSAADPELIMWVLATLIMGAVEGYERFVGTLSENEKRSYFAEMRRFGQAFGLPEEFGPATWNDFVPYWREMLEQSSIGTGPLVHRVAWQVAQPTTPRYLWPLARPLRFLYSELLPQPVRERLGFRSTFLSRAAVKLITVLSPRVIPLLPGWIRFPKEYRRAMARLSM